MMSNFRAGRLRERIDLYDVPGESQDNYGQVAQTASKIGTFWGSIQTLRGRELATVQQAYTLATHRVFLRWLGSKVPTSTRNPHGLIRVGMYLMCRDGSRLDIVMADNEMRQNRDWRLICSEKVRI